MQPFGGDALRDMSDKTHTDSGMAHPDSDALTTTACLATGVASHATQVVVGACPWPSIQFTRCINSHSLWLVVLNYETTLLISINELASDLGEVANPMPIIPDQIKAPLKYVLRRAQQPSAQRSTFHNRGRSGIV